MYAEKYMLYAYCTIYSNAISGKSHVIDNEKLELIRKTQFRN